MFYKLKDRFNRAHFNFQTRGLLNTPPVTMDASLGLHVLSLLQHKDLFMYLAAIKSFAKYVPVQQVHVVNDGSLSERDQRILRKHVQGIAIHGIEQFREQGLPAGGCWERLVAIAQLSSDVYVIQLDADTLTLGPLPEVVKAVQERRSFTIGTWDGQEIEPMLERARLAKEVKKKGVQHIQVEAEAVFEELSEANDLLYVRGCAGFAGFAPGPDKLDLMRNLSLQLQEVLGVAWQEWGSEQVMSNLVVANQPKAFVLPHPSYCDCRCIRPGETRFIHFIGACRFTSDQYSDMVLDLGLCQERRGS